MGIEIERKFLVDTAKERTVRVRIVDYAEAWLTIKGVAAGLSRAEYEYPLPPDEAREMLEGLCEQPFIDKTRHLVEYGGRTWEVDVFHGGNEGLVVAEIELEAADASVELPPWVLKEVSDDHRYSNSSLAKRPWTAWGK